MSTESTALEQARAVADAILYEGYLLYPYRQGSQKNQARFQFGVLMPPGYAVVDPTELSASQTECVLECADDAHVLVTVRFLQLQHRRVEQVVPGTGQFRQVESLTVDGTQYTSWSEAADREQQVRAEVANLLLGDSSVTVHVPAGQESSDIVVAGTGRVAGRVVRSWEAIEAVVQLRAQRVAGPYGALRLRIRTENHTVLAPVPQVRDEALAGALIAAHALIQVPGGTFLSMTDPPEWAAATVKECENIGTWPVLAGPPGRHDLMLSSPVILYDHPQIAPESAGDLFDATEIDEILTLRTLALTDDEKRAARATDVRAADLLDRLDNMPPEMMDRLHGAIRYLRSPGRTENIPGAAGARGAGPGSAGPGSAGPGSAGPGSAGPGNVPWWDPGADASVAPETDHVVIAGVAVSAGSRVVMLPEIGRADAQDLFLAGREATVQAVFQDVDGKVHVAVSPDADPVADLQRSHGRYLYFSADELRPIVTGSTSEPPRAAGQ